MTKTLRRWLLLLFAASVLLALPAAGCMQESPYYEPQRAPLNGPGPSGTAAFTSGEASKTGLKPVKEGARDVVMGEDGGAEDATTPKDTGSAAPKDVPVEFDFGFPPT